MSKPIRRKKVSKPDKDTVLAVLSDAAMWFKYIAIVAFLVTCVLGFMSHVITEVRVRIEDPIQYEVITYDKELVLESNVNEWYKPVIYVTFKDGSIVEVEVDGESYDSINVGDSVIVDVWHITNKNKVIKFNSIVE